MELNGKTMEEKITKKEFIGGIIIAIVLILLCGAAETLIG